MRINCDFQNSNCQNKNNRIKFLVLGIMVLLFSCDRVSSSKSGLREENLKEYITELGIEAERFTHILIVSKIESCNDCMKSKFDMLLNEIERDKVMLIVQTKNSKLANYKIRMWALDEYKLIIDNHLYFNRPEFKLADPSNIFTVTH